MALKMIGNYLTPVEATGAKEAVPVELDLETASRTVDRVAATMGPEVGYRMPLPERIILAPKVVIGPVQAFPRNISDGTIIPLFDEAIPVATMPMERISEYVPDSKYSPAPSSIYGIGPALGTIIVSLGKATVAEIAADVSMDTLQRIGQRVMKNARIRGRTVTKDIGRHVALRDEDGRTGFLPFLKAAKYYTGPCEWYEFWCWLW